MAFKRSSDSLRLHSAIPWSVVFLDGGMFTADESGGTSVRAVRGVVIGPAAVS